MKTFEVDVEGMSCEHCVKAVTKAVREVRGIRDAKVVVGHVHVDAEDDVRRDAVVDAIEEQGYRVPGR